MPRFKVGDKVRIKKVLNGAADSTEGEVGTVTTALDYGGYHVKFDCCHHSIDGKGHGVGDTWAYGDEELKAVE